MSFKPVYGIVLILNNTNRNSNRSITIGAARKYIQHITKDWLMIKAELIPSTSGRPAHRIKRVALALTSWYRAAELFIRYHAAQRSPCSIPWATAVVDQSRGPCDTAGVLDAEISAVLHDHITSLRVNIGGVRDKVGPVCVWVEDVDAVRIVAVLEDCSWWRSVIGDQSERRIGLGDWAGGGWCFNCQGWVWVGGRCESCIRDSHWLDRIGQGRRQINWCSSYCRFNSFCGSNVGCSRRQRDWMINHVSIQLAVAQCI